MICFFQNNEEDDLDKRIKELRMDLIEDLKKCGENLRSLQGSISKANKIAECGSLDKKKCSHPICTGRKEGLCNGCDGEKYFEVAEECAYDIHKTIHDWGLNFNLGSAVRYLTMAGRGEETIKNLRNAIQCIEFEIEELEGGEENE